MLADLRFAQILDLGVHRPAVVPGHAGRLLNESGKHAAALLGVDGLGAEANPEPAWPVPGGGRAMGSRLTGRSPDDEDDPIVDGFWRQDGLVGWIEPVAVAADPLLRRVQLGGGQTGGGHGRAPVPFPDADDDIAAVQVVIIVRERTDRPERLRAGPLWIPRGLELHPLRLDAAAAEEIVEVDREDRAHDARRWFLRSTASSASLLARGCRLNEPRRTRPAAVRGRPAGRSSFPSPARACRPPRSPGSPSRSRRAESRSRSTARGRGRRSRE